MLILSRKEKESFYIGPDIEITIQRVQGDTVFVSINAPKDIRILRKEIVDKIKEENRKAVIEDQTCGERVVCKTPKGETA
jgi:carbon storage regulator